MSKTCHYLTLLLCLSLATPAFAISPEVEELKNTALGTLKLPNYSLGARLESGNGIYASSTSGLRPTLWGYRYSERGGIISSLIFAGAAGVLGSAAVAGAAAPTITETNTTRSTRYNADGSRTVTTTTTQSGYVTAEQGERADQMLKSTEAAMSAITEMRTFGMDLVIFDDEFATLSGVGEGYGFNINFWAPVYGGESFIFELGLGMHNVVTLDRENQEGVQSFFMGVPLRFIFPMGIFYFTGDVNINLYNLLFDDDETRTERIGETQFTFHETQPWSLALSANAILWRIHLEAGIATSRLFSGDFGFNTSASFRF